MESMVLTVILIEYLFSRRCKLILSSVLISKTFNHIALELSMVKLEIAATIQVKINIIPFLLMHLIYFLFLVS